MSSIKKFLGMEKTPRHGGQAPPSFSENMKALRNLPAFFRLVWATSPGLTITSLSLRMIKAGIPLAMLFMGKLILDEVIHLIDTPEEQRSYILIAWYVGGELALAIFSDLLNRGVSLADALLGDLFANKTSVMLMEKAAELDLPQFEDSVFYDKLERARRQTTSRVVLMSQVFSQGEDILSILFLAGGLIVFNPWLILILAVAVIPSFITETYYNRSIYSLQRTWTPERRELDYLRFIGASDQTAKEVKIFGLAGWLTDRFGNLAHNYYLANRKLNIRRTVWGTFFNALGTGAYYGAYVVIIGQTILKLISVGDMTFLAGSFARMRSLLQSVLSRFSSIAQSALYLQDLFDFLAIEPMITQPEIPLKVPEQLTEGFVFENVGFQYPGADKWAVRHLDFHLKAGEKLALVGENGAGKTTLVKLLARLYDPTEGRILLDGKDLKAYDLHQLRQRIGVIFQDFVRFQMLAKENIAVGKIAELANEDLVKDSAVRSLADDVISGLPAQYDQMLGRRFKDGVDLSGGEWQKVALGRAYMRDAQLMILDEPTAALDARAEFEVFKRFSELTSGRTSVLISHRFSTVRMADRILVLKNGEMVEIGTHEELLENAGLYAELFSLQAEGYK